MIINKNKTVAVTGHRIIKNNFDKKELINIFTKLINDGYDCFLIGMAIGFDSLCFNVLENLKNNYDIKIIGCIPCLGQDKLWNNTQKNEYKRQIKKSDDVIILGECYDEYCMKKRNRYIVDNSSVLVAYLYKSSGGTYYTAQYAVEKQKQIIYIK